jgi:hypothetical protein
MDGSKLSKSGCVGRRRFMITERMATVKSFYDIPQGLSRFLAPYFPFRHRDGRARHFRLGVSQPTRYDAAMRFSLKWLLAGIAYVALAAAALIGAPLTLDAHSIVTACAFLYAFVVCLASRWRQAFFVGFFVFSAAHLVAMVFTP